MILTCPDCTARFLLPARTLAPDGRKVKCSACGEIWFQKPDPDELAETADIKLEDIPEAVKPIPEDSNVPAVNESREKGAGFDLISRDRVYGYMAAGFIFLAVLGVLLAMHDSIRKVWPQTTVFYQLAGLTPEAYGEGLIFNDMKARMRHAEHSGGALVIEGQIVNLTEKQQRIPAIHATLRDTSGQNLQSWIIEPPQPSIKGSAEIPFQAFYEPLPAQKSEELYLRFILQP